MDDPTQASVRTRSSGRRLPRARRTTVAAGLRKVDAHFDEWLKDVAPSDELRRWFGHEPSRFSEFRDRYKRELRAGPARAALAELVNRAARERVTLVYSAHDRVHNGAVVLGEEIERRLRHTRTKSTRHARVVHARHAG